MIRLVLCLMLSTGSAYAQTPADAALDQLAGAEAQMRAADTADDRLAALTAAITAYDASLRALRAAARDLAEAEVVQAELLAAQEQQIARLLAVLAAVDRTPQVVRQSHPDGPAATYRAGLLVAGMTPALEAEAARLSQALAARQALVDQQQAVAEALAQGRAGALAARDALQDAMAGGDVLPQGFVDDTDAVAMLASGAETLGGFLGELSVARPDPETRLEPAGNIALPVQGLILPDDGSGRSGVRIAAAPRALVTTPVTATVLYQGPLLDYGTVVILEPAPDLMFVLAGLGDVFVDAGSILPAGAPIGLMPAAQGYDDGILTVNSGDQAGQGAQALYIEVRQGQSVAQTDTWFALE